MKKVKQKKSKKSFSLNKIKWKNVLLISFMFLCISLLVISINEGISWYRDNKKISSQVDDLIDKTNITVVPDNLNT